MENTVELWLQNPSVLWQWPIATAAVRKSVHNRRTHAFNDATRVIFVIGFVVALVQHSWTPLLWAVVAAMVLALLYYNLYDHKTQQTAAFEITSVPLSSTTVATAITPQPEHQKAVTEAMDSAKPLTLLPLKNNDDHRQPDQQSSLAGPMWWHTRNTGAYGIYAPASPQKSAGASTLFFDQRASLSPSLSPSLTAHSKNPYGNTLPFDQNYPSFDNSMARLRQQQQSLLHQQAWTQPPKSHVFPAANPGPFANGSTDVLPDGYHFYTVPDPHGFARAQFADVDQPRPSIDQIEGHPRTVLARPAAGFLP